MNPSTWLVIANRKQAQFFKVETLQDLHLIQTLTLDQFAEEIKDYSDRPGRGNERFGPSRHAIDRSTSPKEREIQVFAHHVGQFLSHSFNKNEFARLYLAAPPDFLGHLRDVLGKNISRAIEKEVAKDLVQQSPQQVLHLLREI